MSSQSSFDPTAPEYRQLKAYAFDPTRGRTLGNYMTIKVRNEPLRPGPVGKYLAVIDYDASNKCYYQPVNLNDENILLQNGLDPSESDPRFHQQMVYAVASETIRRFEHALGRSIKWSFNRWRKDGADGPERLRIFPHAMQEANAFYSRELEALLFGYFPASETDAGANIPGQTVFTCLSHDIIAHETTHALVDSQRDFFMEATSPDAPAFHEAFADIVALFQHFSFKDALLEMIQRTGGQIYRTDVGPESQPGADGPVLQTELTTDNPLVGLARQFGEAMGMRKALRSALGTKPNTDELSRLFEPHVRGSILVAAVFDAFFSIYVRRTSDLLRIARAGGAQIGAGNLHPDLANRLAETTAKTAEQFLNICIRALDYCPPVDILFGDFLRAIITADFDLVPDDQYDYRAAIIEAFRLRGIVPESVSSYSEESLLWCPPETLRPGAKLPYCTDLSFDVFKYGGSKAEREQQQYNAKVLHKFADGNRQLLGLSVDRNRKVQARTFHTVHRVAPDGKLIFDIVAEFTQRRTDVLINPSDPDQGTFIFRGGTTVVFNREGEVRYAIQKSIGEEKDDERNPRLIRQREYLSDREAGFSIAPYWDASEGRMLEKYPMNFSMIHKGY
jgi:hypothetical protein